MQINNPLYIPNDVDSMMFFEHFEESSPRKVLEIGANEEYSACILAENGYEVLGVDLRDQNFPVVLPPSYTRCKADFVQIAPYLKQDFDVIFSTSAVEHFGLCVYGQWKRVEDYDAQTMEWCYKLLRPGGACYITVPYGKEFIEEGDWRVYNRESFQKRIVQDFKVDKKVFFKSGDAAGVPDVNGIVSEEDVDKYHGRPPHCTIWARLIKESK